MNFSSGQTKLSDARVSVVRGYTAPDKVAEVLYLCGPSSTFFHLDTLKVFCVAVSGECCPSWEQLHVNTASKINKLQCGAIGCVYIATRKKSHLTGVQRKEP